jgi:biotin-dependent carboxylase-like uncharacterized protein
VSQLAGPALAVLEPGLLTTVQDQGRRGWQRFGVPVSGAADTEALRVANLLVGNDPGVAGLEVTHRGPLLEVSADSVRVAVAGTRCDLAVETPNGERTAVDAWRSLTLRRGARLRVGRVLGGLRCYLGVAGGFALPPVLGSLATSPRSGVGPVEGRELRRDDRLPLALGAAPPGDDHRLIPPSWWDEPGPLRAVPGPDADRLDAAGAGLFYGTEYTVSPSSDRSGLRLLGPRITGAGGDIASEGCPPGTVQLPASGLPIVLGPDRGTTGGYAKVATVISADVSRLGRLRPGSRVAFLAVDVGEALRRRRHREMQLVSLGAFIQRVQE